MSYYERIIAAEAKAVPITEITHPLLPSKCQGLRHAGPDATVRVGIEDITELGPEFIIVSSVSDFRDLLDEVIQYKRPRMGYEERKQFLDGGANYVRRRAEATRCVLGTLGWMGVRATVEDGSTTWLNVHTHPAADLTALELASITAAPHMSEFDQLKLRRIGYKDVQEVGGLIIKHNFDHPSQQLFVPSGYYPQLDLTAP